jgi:hypothetical protein
LLSSRCPGPGAAALRNEVTTLLDWKLWKGIEETRQDKKTRGRKKRKEKKTEKWKEIREKVEENKNKGKERNGAHQELRSGDKNER